MSVWTGTKTATREHLMNYAEKSEVGITKRELTDCPFMEPYTDGSFVATSEVGNAWRCDGCGLVWDRKHYAQFCSTRGHKIMWERGYGATMVVNGVPNHKGFEPVYAIRREELDAPCPPDSDEMIALQAQRIAERTARRNAAIESCKRQDDDVAVDDLLLEMEIELSDKYDAQERRSRVLRFQSAWNKRDDEDKIEPGAFTPWESLTDGWSPFTCEGFNARGRIPVMSYTPPLTKTQCQVLCNGLNRQEEWATVELETHRTKRSTV